MIKLTEEQLKEKAAFINDYIGNADNNASNSEVDPNANVTLKNVATLDTEVNKAEDVQINRYILGQKIAELFGDDEKRKFYSMLENHEIYSHDESAILKPYCVAIDLSPFLVNGNIPLGGSSKAPHNIRSFCGTYVNLMFLVAGQFAGAVADVSLFLWFDFFARKEFGDNYLSTNKRDIDGFLSQIVYTLNDPSTGRGGQSIFYNTSIFDKGYFEALFGNLVFPDGSSPVYEKVDRLQRYFMHWFNEERTKALLTFPVVTAAYLTENGTPKYPEFVDFLACELAEGNSFFQYHSDNPDSLSSCCFAPDQKVYVLSDVIAGDGVDASVTRALSYTFSELWDKSIASGDFIYDTHYGKAKLVRYPGVPMVRIEVYTMFGSVDSIVCTNNHLFPVRRKGSVSGYVDVRADDIHKEDGLLDVYGDYRIVKSVRPLKKIPEYVYCFEMIDQTHPYFVLANNIVTHNCRLRNKVDVRQFTYTLGGTGVMTGSKKVFTINVNRMVQQHKDITEVLRHVYKYLVAYNELLWVLEARHMLPAYDAGYIHLDKQYLTVGVNGVIEAAEYLKFDTTHYSAEYEAWLKDLFSTISAENKVASDYYTKAMTHKVMLNCEIVPAENVGVKFAKWDKAAGYKVPRDCYNSYLYEVENPDTTILDKFMIQGKELTDSIDGGAAVHLNLKECPNKGTWLKIIQMAITAGCNYWTSNIRETCCEDCGYISKEDRNSCPKCGSTNVTWATRIIGYLKKVTSFSKDRQLEEKRRFRA